MKIKLMNIVDIILLLLIIIKTNSIYLNIGLDNKLNFFFVFITIIAVFLEIITSQLSFYYFKKMLMVVAIYFFVIISNIVVSLSSLSLNSLLHYFIIAPLVFVLIMYKYHNKVLRDFVSIFVNLVIVLAVVSLFFWLFGSVLKMIQPTNYVVNNWSGGRITASYHNLYFETQSTSFLGNRIIRNSGIFAEAPMWSLVLSVALIFQGLLLTPNTKRFIFLVFTILTTASTTGFFIIGLLMIYIVANQKRSLFKYFSLTIIPALIYALAIAWGEKSDTSSANIRFDDYISGFLAWKNSFIFGSGLTEGLRVIESYMDTTIRHNLGYSNSFFIILAQGGLVLGIYYFYPVIRILFSKNFSRNSKMFAFLFLMLLFTAIFTETPLFLVLVGMFYGLILNRENA